MKKYKDSETLRESGRRLELYLEFLDLSQTDFANTLGFSRSQVSNWITGNQRIGLDAMLAMSETYGITLEYIYFGRLRVEDISFRKFLASRSDDK